MITDLEIGKGNSMFEDGLMLDVNGCLGLPADGGKSIYEGDEPDTM